MMAGLTDTCSHPRMHAVCSVSSCFLGGGDGGIFFHQIHSRHLPSPHMLVPAFLSP